MANSLAKDLVLKLKSLTNEFTTGDAVSELGDLDRALSDTAREARTSSREVKAAAADMDDNFDPAATEAETTARRMRAAAADIGDGIRDGATRVNTETTKIKSDMASTGKEAGAELVSNIAEGIGSGTGSVTDVVQGTLGGIVNMAAQIPGPFAVAGAAAAAGVGVLFASMKKQAEEAKARFDLIVAGIEEVGNAATQAGKKRMLADWLDTMKEMPDKLADIRGGLQEAKISGETFADALAGDKDAAEDIRAKLQEVTSEIIEQQRETGEITPKQAEILAGQQAILAELDKQNGALSDAKDFFSDINYLTSTTSSTTGEWKNDVAAVKREAELLNDALNTAFRDRTVKATVVVKDQNGKNIRLPDPRSNV